MRDFYAPRGSIDTLQVVDGAIKTAKIGDAQVDTLQLKGEAVTIPRLAYIPNPTIALKDNVGHSATTYSLVNVPNPPSGSSRNFHAWAFEVARASFDPMGGSVNVEQTVNLAREGGIPVIASGGVTDMKDIELLKPYGDCLEGIYLD